MAKKMLLILLLGVVIGGALGYYVGRYQAPPAASLPPAPGGGGRVGNTASPGGSGMSPGGGMGVRPPAAPSAPSPQETQLRQEVDRLQTKLKAAPEDLKTLTELANRYYDMKDFKQAVAYYERAAAKDPADLSIKVDLATSYWYLGDADRAVAGLTEVLKKDPKHPQALNNMGIIMLHGKNDLAGAREYWVRLLNSGTKEVDLEGVRRRVEVIDKMLKEQAGAAGKKD